jgi:hypothetical protein
VTSYVWPVTGAFAREHPSEPLQHQPVFADFDESLGQPGLVVAHLVLQLAHQAAQPRGQVLVRCCIHDRSHRISGGGPRQPGCVRRVSDYIKTNIHITSSGMLQERLPRHTLDFTSADQVLFSTDYPFHRPDAAAIRQFFDAIPQPAERTKIASGNAEALFRLA